jgi:hypothetical protein
MLPTDHELSTTNLQEPGEVLDLVRGGQLTTCCYAESHETLIHDGCALLVGFPKMWCWRLTIQIGSRRIDGCGVASWAGAMRLSVSAKKKDGASAWWGVQNHHKTRRNLPNDCAFVSIMPVARPRPLLTDYF